MNNQKKENLLKKLKRPTHIDHISKYILMDSKFDTQKEIDQLILDGLIEESIYAKKYYVIKNLNEN